MTTTTATIMSARQNFGFRPQTSGTRTYLTVNTPSYFENNSPFAPRRSPSQSSFSSASTTDTMDSKDSKKSTNKKSGLFSRIKDSISTRHGHQPTEASSSTSYVPQAQQDESAAQFNEPPPSYESIANVPSISVPSLSTSSSQARRNVFSSPRNTAPRTAAAPESLVEDRYAFLSHFDTVFIIDDSASMIGSRWREAKEVLRRITSICAEHDEDGLDIYFINHRSNVSPPATKGRDGYYGVKTAEKIEDIFNKVRPSRDTMIGQTLRRVLLPYLAAYERAAAVGQQESLRPVNVIVITDGEPSDDLGTEVRALASQLDDLRARPAQVGIQFFQVGDDAIATESLRRLDDDMTKAHGVRDIIDTVTWDNRSRHTLTPDTILKTVLGAVHRRLDNEKQVGRR